MTRYSCTPDSAPPEPHVVFEQLMPLVSEHTLRCMKLASLARRLGAAVESESTDELLDTLAERERVIATITQTDAALRPLLEVWSRVSVGATPDQIRLIRAGVESAIVAIDEVSSRDAEDRVSLERRRDELAVAAADTGRRLAGTLAYAPKQASSPRFQDRAG